MRRCHVLKIIDGSGLRYCFRPFGTCIEGECDEVMELSKRCHEQSGTGSSHDTTTVRIADEAGCTNKLNENIASVEWAVGHKLHTANGSAIGFSLTIL